MIVQENITVGTRELLKTYSNENKYIIQNETGIKYSEAVDIIGKFTYTESDEIIENELTNEEILEEIIG